MSTFTAATPFLRADPSEAGAVAQGVARFRALETLVLEGAVVVGGQRVHLTRLPHQLSGLDSWRCRGCAAWSSPPACSLPPPRGHWRPEGSR